jgi:CRP-like cAMP-binding protein
MNPDIPTATAYRIRRQGHPPIEALFEESVTPQALELLVDYGMYRVASKGDVLRNPAKKASDVHVVIRGCVAERTDLPATTLRFAGRGSVLGDTEVMSDAGEGRWVRAVCLSKTWTVAFPLSRKRNIAENETSVMKFLATAVVERHRTAEWVYTNVRRTPHERVATLLQHLHQTSGKMVNHDDPARVVINGPTQAELADSLMLSRATIEKVMADMRDAAILDTGYRTYRVRLRDLAAVESGTIDFPAPKKAGKTVP